MTLQHSIFTATSQEIQAQFNSSHVCAVSTQQ